VKAVKNPGEVPTYPRDLQGLEELRIARLDLQPQTCNDPDSRGSKVSLAVGVTSRGRGVQPHFPPLSARSIGKWLKIQISDSPPKGGSPLDSTDPMLLSSRALACAGSFAQARGTLGFGFQNLIESP